MLLLKSWLLLNPVLMCQFTWLSNTQQDANRKECIPT
jgi:hypothetical protein